MDYATYLERVGVAMSEIERGSIEHLEAMIQELHSRRKPMGVLKMIGVIASVIVSVSVAGGYVVNDFTNYGWVTRSTFDSTVLHLVTHDEFEARNEAQDATIQANGEVQNQILAEVQYAPQLRVLIKIRCMGSTRVQPTIEKLEADYEKLAGHKYEEPSCDDPQLKDVIVR